MLQVACAHIAVVAVGITCKAEATFIADAMDKSAEAVLKARLEDFLKGE